MVSFFQSIPGRSRLSDTDILRASIIAELDAINLYQGFADVVGDSHIRIVLLDIAREEKIHVGEFQEMLLRIDEEHRGALHQGTEEIDKLIEK